MVQTSNLAFNETVSEHPMIHFLWVEGVVTRTSVMDLSEFKKNQYLIFDQHQYKLGSSIVDDQERGRVEIFFIFGIFCVTVYAVGDDNCSQYLNRNLDKSFAQESLQTSYNPIPDLFYVRNHSTPNSYAEESKCCVKFCI